MQRTCRVVVVSGLVHNSPTIGPEDNVRRSGGEFDTEGGFLEL